MVLDIEECLRRMHGSDHGVLCTLHPERGIDAVPVCFVVVAGHVVVPVDRVKQKSSTSLQRVANLEADPRATLLCEHWDRDDWDALWWVRASLRSVPDVVGSIPDLREHAADRLRAAYRQYRDEEFAALIVLELVEVAGWAAVPGPTASGAPTTP